jgi:hypothetical protein
LGFSGRIVPERVPLSVLPSIRWSSSFESPGVAYDVSLGVADGQVSASVKVTSGAPDIHTLRGLVAVDLQAMVDLIGYAVGLQYAVDIISAASLDSADRVVFGIRIPVLAERVRLDFGKLDADLIASVTQNVATQMALRDFNEAMGNAVNTAFYCYRAIETLMQDVRAEGDNDRQAWDRFRAALRVDRRAIDYIERKVADHRHGKLAAINHDERTNLFRITDEVIWRHLNFLKSGRLDLAEDDFPMYSTS